MHNLQDSTFSALETALYWAIKGEEMLNYLCSEKYDGTKTQDCQTEEVQQLLEDWRKQKSICERIAKCIVSLDSEYKDSRFNPATLDGKGIHTLKTFSERKQEGTLIITFKD